MFRALRWCYVARAVSNSLREELAKIGRDAMDKIIECAKVDPSSGCTHVVRGKNEEEVLKNAMEHAKEHGIREVTPELVAKVKAAIRDAD
jgi:predicted small metal-binding protein